MKVKNLLDGLLSHEKDKIKSDNRENIVFDIKEGTRYM